MKHGDYNLAHTNLYAYVQHLKTKKKHIMMRMDFLCYNYILHLRLNLLYILEMLNGDCTGGEAIGAQPFFNGRPLMNTC